MKFESHQAVFDHVVTSLVKQGQPSMATRSGGLVCVYRGNDGRKCAAGWCIDDAEYTELMEGGRIRCLVDGTKLGINARLTHLAPYAGLLDELQRAHDDPAREIDMTAGSWLEAFVKEARRVAGRYGLKESALDAALGE